jgi:CheY-like chemotaxis protein
MRRKRAVVFEDDVVIMGLLKMFLSLRGYDFYSYREPLICPVYKDDTECSIKYPCADIMLIDFSMPKMSGAELLKAQTIRQCKLTPNNKALITGYFDGLNRAELEQMGCAVFEKPIDFSRLAEWFDQCEQRMDLTKPLGLVRMEKRQPCNIKISFQTAPASTIQTGIATNFSPSGLCLKVTVTLWLHQTLTIIHSDKAHPSRPASVRWVKTLGNNSFETGLHLEGNTS